MKNNSDLFFTCSLIEYIGRQCKLRRSDVVEKLGKQNLKRIYKYADVLHCEPIAKTADEYIQMLQIETGSYDNVKTCRYEVPDYWTMGEVFERLIEDVVGEDVVETLMQVMTSWIIDALSNYNSDFYYQPREYIRECYLAGEVI